MIALQHSQFGEPVEVLTPSEVPIPEPAAGQVRLKILRSPIHHHDLATIRGIYGERPPLPATAGSEVLGTLDAVGPGVSSFESGTRLCAITRGGWAQYALAAAAMLVPAPEGLEDEVACQLLAMPLSAVVLFDDLLVKPGDWIVQNAANGAVGTILMRVAQSSGVNVINLVRSDAAAHELRANGAKYVVVTASDDWCNQAREIAKGSPIVRAIDSITGGQSLELQRLLGPFGELIVFGGLSGGAMKLDPSLMISHELTVRGFWMTAWQARATPGARAIAVRRVFDLALKNELPLPVAGTYALSDAVAALRASQGPTRKGKILFAP